MPNLILLPITVGARPQPTLMGYIRTLYVKNPNRVVGDDLTVRFESGEVFTIPPLGTLELNAEDCSPDSNSGKICSQSIIFSAIGHTITPQCNYTFYSMNRIHQNLNTVEIR